MEEKNKEIISYIKSKVKAQEDVIVEVYVDFKDDMRLSFYYLNALPNISVIPMNRFEQVEKYMPYEYLQSLQNK